MTKPILAATAATAAAAVLALQPVHAQAPSCTHTVGMVVSLTGPAGRFGQAAAKSVELAFNELNAAAGAGAGGSACHARSSSAASSARSRSRSSPASPRPRAWCRSRPRPPRRR